MLDLDRFEEYRGRTDLDAMHCPHCGAVRATGTPPRMIANLWRIRSCPTCCRDFYAVIVETPLGLAWQTWDKDPRPGKPEKPVDTPPVS